jgi:hypothetical protein
MAGQAGERDFPEVVGDAEHLLLAIEQLTVLVEHTHDRGVTEVMIAGVPLDGDGVGAIRLQRNGLPHDFLLRVELADEVEHERHSLVGVGVVLQIHLQHGLRIGVIDGLVGPDPLDGDGRKDLILQKA